MIRAATFCAAAAVAVCFGAAAETYPLTFKTVPPEKMDTFAGGYGMYGQLRLVKPAGIKKETKPVSKRPLYGESRESDTGIHFVFRLDESKGNGSGYDQLIVDMNQNGDLTDDTAGFKVEQAEATGNAARRSGPTWFGPIKAAPGKEFCGGTPVFYAQVYVPQRLPDMPQGANMENVYAGYIRLKPAWYLEATVQVDGKQKKLGVYDGDGNLRLGDLAEPQTYENGSEKNWYFRPGDIFFVDEDDSGSFERDPMGIEERPFGSIIYLGSTPCKASLDANCSSIRLEPWTDALADVNVEPKGQYVHDVLVAWEHPAGKWQLLNTPVTNGKIKVPPGRYRFYACNLLGKATGSDQVMVSANQRVPKTPMKFDIGKTGTLRCGAPLEAVATAEKRMPQSWEVSGNSRDETRDSEYIVRINSNFRGVDGEVYSTFAKGPKLAGEPPKPVFTVTGADGKQVAKGNLEFG